MQDLFALWGSMRALATPRSLEAFGRRRPNLRGCSTGVQMQASPCYCSGESNRPLTPILRESLNSREGDPPKKPPTQIKTVCTNSVRKLFCLFSAYFKGKRGAICINCPEIVCANCLCKLFLFGWAVFGVGLPFMINGGLKSGGDKLRISALRVWFFRAAWVFWFKEQIFHNQFAECAVCRNPESHPCDSARHLSPLFGICAPPESPWASAVQSLSGKPQTSAGKFRCVQFLGNIPFPERMCQIMFAMFCRGLPILWWWPLWLCGQASNLSSRCPSCVLL